MTGIELEAIEFQRNGKSLFQPLSLSVGPGEYLTLAGPSGGGKTTLLRIVAGLEVPYRGGRCFRDSSDLRSTRGSVSGEATQRRLFSSDTGEWINGARDIAMVFQGGGLYPHLTVQENLEFSQRIRGFPAVERKSKAERMAERLGVLGLMHRLPEQLSGGESQRVAIGRALMQDPKILLLDEPLANLDGPLRVQLRRLIRKLHQEQNLTTIHVTHDQEEALALGDRVAVLHEGRFQQIDRPEIVYHRPINRWVAGFIGSPPMNFFVGELRDKSCGKAFAFRSNSLGEVTLPRAVVPMLPVGTPWEVGLRPEFTTVDEESASSHTGNQIEAELERTEFTGTNLWWQVRCGSETWMIRGLPHTNALKGSRWRLHLDWGAAVWFHPTTGVAVA